MQARIHFSDAMTYSINDRLEFDCELRAYCSALLPRGYCLPHVPRDLFLRVVDHLDCSPVSGLLFELSMQGAIPEYAVSDEDGLLAFFAPCPGSYELRMLSDDTGACTLREEYRVYADPLGRVQVDSLPSAMHNVCVRRNGRQKGEML